MDIKKVLNFIGDKNPKYSLENQVYIIPSLIQFIDNPSEQVQMEALNNYPYAIYNILAKGLQTQKILDLYKQKLDFT
jgi:hypothetical protein